MIEQDDAKVPAETAKARKQWETPVVITSAVRDTEAHVTRFTDGSRAGFSYGS